MNPATALVTGGASGLGRIYALRMAGRGVRVAVLDRDAEALQKMLGESPALVGIACDVADAESVAAAVENAREELGSIERLVHCAAIMPTARLIDQETAEIQRMMAVNYGGTVNVTKALLPDMLARGRGEIILFGSTGGSVLVPECGSYCATKAATNAFAEVLIEETRDSGVHVMLVCPPLVDTPLLQQAMETSAPKTIRLSIERKRFVDPEFVIDEVERGLSRRTEIVLPGTEAKVLLWARRLAPRLLWRLIRLSDRG